MPLYDCLIIGGGPAGLSTALGLCRAIRSCVVFDDGRYRNWATSYMHTVSTWDHRRPEEYRQAAAAELLNGRYDTVAEIATSPVLNVFQRTIEYHDTTNVNVMGPAYTGSSGERRERKIFVAIDQNGMEWYGRTVVFASGVEDVLPSGENIPGFAEGWGQSIFHCLFCHGYEERNKGSAGILILAPGSFQFSAAFAGMASRLATSITVYTNALELGLTPTDNETETPTPTPTPGLDDLQDANGDEAMPDQSAPKKVAHIPPSNAAPANAELKAIEGLLLRNGFSIDTRPIKRLVPHKTNVDRSNENEPPSIDIHFHDGSVATHTFLVCRPDQQVRNRRMMELLGVHFNANTGLAEVVSPMNATHVPGVFVAGDNNTMYQQVVNAFCQGGMVSGGVHHYLLTKELNGE